MRIRELIGNVLEFLLKEKMVVSAGEKITATPFGRRVSELYIDPISAVIIRDGLLRAKEVTERSFLHLICYAPDMTPKLYLRRKDVDDVYAYLDQHEDEFLIPIPDEWRDPVGYERFLATVKTTMVLESWIEEIPEDGIIERFGVESGDLFRLVNTAEWLLYASYELGKLFDVKECLPLLYKLRDRTKYGVKSELLPLVRLRGIGRVRARMLYSAGLRTIRDLKKASIEKLMSIPTIGPTIARQIKEQVGVVIKPEEWERLKKEKWEQKTLAES
jgi:helicase